MDFLIGWFGFGIWVLLGFWRVLRVLLESQTNPGWGQSGF